MLDHTLEEKYRCEQWENGVRIHESPLEPSVEFSVCSLSPGGAGDTETEGGVQAAIAGEALSAEEVTEGEQGHTDFWPRAFP